MHTHTHTHTHVKPTMLLATNGGLANRKSRVKGKCVSIVTCVLLPHREREGFPKYLPIEGDSNSASVERER